MYAPGKHIHACSRDKPYGDYYQPQLCMLSEFLQSLLSSCFHWKTLSIQCGLEGYDKKPPEGGDKGLAKSVNILVILLIQHIMIQMMMAVVLGFGLRKTNISVHIYFVMSNILVEDIRRKLSSSTCVGTQFHLNLHRLLIDNEAIDYTNILVIFH